MASAPALAPIKALDGLFLAMLGRKNNHEMSQDTNVLQKSLKMA
jgi:hypothetical protein